ncbi:hypothetical protein UFOVP688_19 [uncultured Caudovirales phage]|uniref:Uncharacterized protein n=1 Tax=uncultured Caudovirales phage TaxID=2100421 RepID=A0A6J5NKG3_9CAUD|nr:hypothetical protein UFOVP688_19 [uncultured Caudovirales phage]
MSGFVTSGQIAVGTTPVEISVKSNNPVVLHIHNDDNTTDCFVGPQSVSITTGLRLIKMDSIELTLHQANTIWVVSSKTGHNISWFAQGL